MGIARFLLSAYATVPVYEAFFRSHGWGDALDPMVEGVERGRPQARARARARGPDPRDRHLRLAGGAARAARGVHRGRDHDAGAVVPRQPRPAAGPDRRAGSLSLERIWPDRAAVTADELVGAGSRGAARTARGSARSWSPRSTGARRWTGTSRPLGGPQDLQMLLALRRRADALIVGPGTVRAEGYGPLPCPAVLVSRSFDAAVGGGAVRRARAARARSTRARRPSRRRWRPTVEVVRARRAAGRARRPARRAASSGCCARAGRRSTARCSPRGCSTSCS